MRADPEATVPASDNFGAGPHVPCLRASALEKTYPGVAGKPDLRLFRSLDLTVQKGEMVAIVGRSGTGKSTLLHLLAGLERPTTGSVEVAGTVLGGLAARELAEVRNRRIGYVWQFHYLLPEFSAVENVALPLLARGLPRAEALREAMVWMKQVGLGPRAQHRSGELSGGEQQRVAMARAVVTRPAVLLADEPTGDLDDQTAEELFALLQQLCRRDELGVVLVTHNSAIARSCDRVLHLRDGQLHDG